MNHPTHPQKNKVLLFFVIATAVTLLGAIAWQKLLFHKLFPPELIFGWLFAVAHGVLALWINLKSIGYNTTRFFLWAFGLNAFRFLFLLILLASIKEMDIGNYFPFLVVALWGYMVFMVSEIGSLHTREF